MLVTVLFITVEGTLLRNQMHIIADSLSSAQHRAAACTLSPRLQQQCMQLNYCQHYCCMVGQPHAVARNCELHSAVYKLLTQVLHRVAPCYCDVASV
jgi:hypothetical protein